MENQQNHNLLFWMQAGNPTIVFVFGVHCQHYDDLARVVSVENKDRQRFIDA